MQSSIICFIFGTQFVLYFCEYLQVTDAFRHIELAVPEKIYYYQGLLPGTAKAKGITISYLR